MIVSAHGHRHALARGRSGRRVLAVAVVAGVGLASGPEPAAAWEIPYQAPERGLREIYANGEHKIVSQSRKRVDTWCIYDAHGNLLRRTLTYDAFFVIERTRFRPSRRDQDSPPNYRATVHLPDGSIWPLTQGKSVRFEITVAGAPGKPLRVIGRLSVVGRRSVAVGEKRYPAVIVRSRVRHWYEAYPVGDSLTEYAYFPAFRNAIVIKNVLLDPERPVRWPAVVRIEGRTGASVRRLIQSDCGPPMT